MTSIGDIVTEWMIAHGYDGLSRDGECECCLGDLMPCGEPSDWCVVGYVVDDESGDGYRVMDRRPV